VARRLWIRDGALGLVLLVVGVHHAHRLALAQFGEQRLRVELRVGLDDVVGRAQDRAGGAVVLLQLDDLELRVVDRQLLEVVQRGAAPAVDRLVVVAHGGEAAALAHQQLEQLVLRGVGVLVLIDQHMAQRLLPLGAHLGEVAQEAQRHADQVVEIHALVGRQALFVALHDHGDAALVVVLGLGEGLGAVEAGVLPGADGPLPLARGGDVGGAAGGVLDDAGHVVGVEDAELGLQAEHGAVFAHHAHAQGVEGADQHVLGRAADQVLRALAHFRGRLVREGDGGDAARLQAGLDQPADLHRDHARLARAGAGQHEAGPLRVVDGLELGEVETGGHAASGAEKRGREGAGRGARSSSGRQKAARAGEGGCR